MRNSILLCIFLFLAFHSTELLKAQIGDVVWEENFSSLDTNIWNIEIGDGCPDICGWGNQELQWYKKENISIGEIPDEPGNKALIIEAKKEICSTKEFTSGRISTKSNLSVKYGMIEIRMNTPNLQNGLWPAAWLLGTSSGWPANGEVDIMEMGQASSERKRQGHENSDVNSYVGSNLIFYTEDACKSNPSCAASIAWDADYNKPYVAKKPLNNRFVIYRMYWTHSNIRFTIEDSGVEHDLYEAPFPISAESEEFRKPFYLILNMAVGGIFTDLLKNEQITAEMPAKMYVDYIKVFKFNGEGEVNYYNKGSNDEIMAN